MVNKMDNWKVSKCQECLAEIRNVIASIGIEASRIIVLSGQAQVKRKAKLIYTASRKIDILLREKDGEQLLPGKGNATEA